MSMEERSELTKEQQVRYEDILKQETEQARQGAPLPSSKVVSIKDLKRSQEKAEKDLANWPTPATSAEPDDGADSELEKHEADARRAERKALMQELNNRHAVI